MRRKFGSVCVCGISFRQSWGERGMGNEERRTDFFQLFEE